MKKLGLILITVFLIATTFAWAAPTTDTATVSWTAPTTNTDDSTLTDLAGYKVYHRMGPTYDTPGIDVGDVTTYQFTGLPNGTHYFVVTAYNTGGHESVNSNEGERIIDFFTIPSAAADVVVGP